MRFGDYIVYVDESGDHNMIDFDPDYPRFVLAFCIYPVAEYVDVVVPMVERLKFDFFGHDMVVLHEREIRQSRPPFDFLLDARVREPFMTRLDELVSRPRFGIVATVIRKPEFKERMGLDVSPYNVALEYGLERVFLQLQARNQVGRRTFVVFEGRGRKEDAELELEFRRIMDDTRMRGMPQTLQFICVSKQSNSPGLQVADLVARPIGIHDLRPHQPNHAWDVLSPKLVRRDDRVHGIGLKVYP
jgi:hypothetical protein